MTEPGRFAGLGERLPEIGTVLREAELGGWLLFDVHGRNPVAAGLLGLNGSTRRWFVLIPAAGEPTALIHGMERAPWADWPWRSRRYAGWRDLEAELRGLLSGIGPVAMEVSPLDAVPALDLVPAGMLELVTRCGGQVVPSGDLVTRFHARWTADQLASHVRAAQVLAEVARTAFGHAAAAVSNGEALTEGSLRGWVVDRLAAEGCGAGASSIVAGGPRTADPHYEPVGEGAVLRRGDVLLVDLWAKEAEDSVFADQTWMGFLGSEVPGPVREVWRAVRDARDAAVEFLQRRWAEGAPVEGREVDDAARSVIAGRGWAAAFLHRTGHSIDREVHGRGPNLDNLETRETRRLMPGIGFSIEPGIYLEGEFGVRSEINVYLGPNGPQVTTPSPQTELPALLPG